MYPHTGVLAIPVGLGATPKNFRIWRATVARCSWRSKSKIHDIPDHRPEQVTRNLVNPKNLSLWLILNSLKIFPITSLEVVAGIESTRRLPGENSNRWASYSWTIRTITMVICEFWLPIFSEIQGSHVCHSCGVDFSGNDVAFSLVALWSTRINNFRSDIIFRSRSRKLMYNDSLVRSSGVLHQFLRVHLLNPVTLRVNLLLFSLLENFLPNIL